MHTAPFRGKLQVYKLFLIKVSSILSVSAARGAPRAPERPTCNNPVFSFKQAPLKKISKKRNKEKRNNAKKKKKEIKMFQRTGGGPSAVLLSGVPLYAAQRVRYHDLGVLSTGAAL